MNNEIRTFDIIKTLNDKGYSTENLILWFLGVEKFSDFKFDTNSTSKILSLIILALFRKKFNILIEITLKDGKYGFIISEIPSGKKICDDMDIYPVKYFTTWEESVMMAIKYCTDKYIV